MRSTTVLLGDRKAAGKTAKQPEAGPWFDILSFFFLGMSGWWVYQALYMEAPIFVQCKNETTASYMVTDSSGNSTYKPGCTYTLPEGDNITNQMSAAGQIGNAFLFIYRIFGRFCGSRRIRLPLVIGIWLGIGCISAVVAAFFWQTHVRVFNVDRSVPLLLVALFSGGLGCISSQTYWQFAADFPARSVLW